jgi:hypothetical protein
MVLLACPIPRADGGRPGWKPDEAGKYLDELEKAVGVQKNNEEGDDSLLKKACCGAASWHLFRAWRD